jgi:hypothetical protein
MSPAAAMENTLPSRTFGVKFTGVALTTVVRVWFEATAAVGATMPKPANVISNPAKTARYLRIIFLF